MDTFDRDALAQLIAVDSKPCVSLFMPTHASGPDMEQDAIRLRKLLSAAEQQLGGHWMRAPEARRMLAPAASLPADNEFWSKRGAGLAVFLTPDNYWAYRLPISFHEVLAVSYRFRVRPLLPAVDNHRRFYLLALSQNECGLYLARNSALERLEVVDLPRNMKQALNYDQVDRGAQVHSASNVMVGKQAAVFHGQGGKPEKAKTDLVAFLRQVNKAVVGRLATAREPLALAAVGSVAASYRAVNTYPYLMDETITGNFDDVGPRELFERASPLTSRRADQDRVKAAARYEAGVAGGRATDDLRELLPAAVAGRVDVLFHDPRASVHGSFEAPSGEVVVSGRSEDDELIDLAVVETLRRRGTIHSMQDQPLPTNSAVAAVLRY